MHSESLLKHANDLKILYEDNHLLCVNKPAMMPVQADSSGDADLLSICKAYIKQKYDKPGAVYLGLVHRLDRPVGGSMVFARTSKAAARLQKSMQSGSWKKKYLAVVCGDTPKNAELSDYLLKDESSHKSYVVPENTANAKFAQLHLNTVAASDGLSLVAIELETGRHHQIRVQLSHRSYPIWGDAKYNPRSRSGESIALLAHKLSFPHPINKAEIQLISEIPHFSPWSNFFDNLRAF